MVSYRALIANGSPADVQTAELHLRGLLDEADKVLAPSDDDAVAAFIGALTILLREGLEALLVVVAMLAFLKKAERKDVLIYVHAGWASALAAGGITWAVATYLVGVSGASRELTEGFSSLFAAVVLLGVGMWMHQKSVAGRWQVYLKEKLSSALNKRTAWFLFSLAFVAVYREVFETVLFYAALWTEGNGWPLLAGLAPAGGLGHWHGNPGPAGSRAAAHQCAPADWPVLRCQLTAGGHTCRGLGRQGHRRSARSRVIAYQPNIDPTH